MTVFPIISMILFLPLLGAAGAALLPREAGWGFALVTALADLVFCLLLIMRFASTTPGMQFTEHLPWLPQLGINYALGVDGINLFLLTLHALLTLIPVVASLS